MERNMIQQYIDAARGIDLRQDPYAHGLVVSTHPLPSNSLDRLLLEAQALDYLNAKSGVMFNLYPPLFQQEYFAPIAADIMRRYGESIADIEFLNMICDFGDNKLDMGTYQTARLPMSAGYLINFKNGKKVFGPMVATDLKLLFGLREGDGFNLEELLKAQIGFGYRHLEAMAGEMAQEGRKYDAIYYTFPAPPGFEDGKTISILKACGAIVTCNQDMVSVQFGELTEKELEILNGISQINDAHFSKLIKGIDFAKGREIKRLYMIQLANAMIRRAGTVLGK